MSYAAELSQEVKVVAGLPTEWGICSRTVTLDHLPLALTCWKDTIAVGSESNIITIDGITGSQSAVLSGHSDYVRSLAFSPDGTSLVSGSSDDTIKLWDVQTGGIVKTFYGHTAYVSSVSISEDCTVIASGSADKTIRLWNIQMEECYHVIMQQGCVDYLRFSPRNSQCLISVSDNKVWWLDTNGHETNDTHNGSHIAFSLDGTLFAVCQGEAVIVQDSDSKAIVAEFHIANNEPHHCCFSPDSAQIAVTVNSTIYIWETTSSDPHPIMTFVGHAGSITSLTFSSASSLISSSYDNSVKFWQISIPSTDSDVADPGSTPLALAQIKSITLQAEYGLAISSDSDGVVKTWDISTGLCRRSYYAPVSNPQCCDVRMFWGGPDFIWYADEKLHKIDLVKGKYLRTMDMPEHGVYSIRISGDGSKVFYLRWWSIQARSMQTGEVLGEVELKPFGLRRSLTVDGSRVWIHSPSSEPLEWDLDVPGSSPIQLSNTPFLHPNATNLWDIGESKIKDTVSGEVIFQLGGTVANPVDSQWDGRYLVAGYKSGKVVILDFNHMLCQ